MLHIKFKNGCMHCHYTFAKCYRTLKIYGNGHETNGFFYLHKKMRLFNCVHLQGCFFQITSWIKGENGKLSAQVHTNVYLNIVL